MTQARFERSTKQAMMAFVYTIADGLINGSLSPKDGIDLMHSYAKNVQKLGMDATFASDMLDEMLEDTKAIAEGTAEAVK